MKKVLFSLAFVTGLSFMNAQSVLFEDSFESYEDFLITGIGDWIMIDVDGLGTYSGGGGTFANQFDPKAFMVFNPITAGVTNSDSGEETRNFDPRTGDKYMGCWAANGGPNDDWMVSPAITLGASGNVAEFYVKSLSDTYGLEELNYYVFVGDGVPTPAEFEWYDSDTAPYGNWMLVSMNLDSYAGQTVRIGIQCVSNDAYMLMVDDFKVNSATMGVSDLSANSGLYVYPNPTTSSFNLNLPDKFVKENLSVTVIDLTGRTVKSFAGVNSYDVSSLPKGVYLIKATDGKNTETTKLLKK